MWQGLQITTGLYVGSILLDSSMLANNGKMSLPTDTGVFCDQHEPFSLQ